jgi:hypothetical protein
MIGLSSCSDIPKAGKSILSLIVMLVLLYDLFTWIGNNVSSKIDRILYYQIWIYLVQQTSWHNLTQLIQILYAPPTSINRRRFEA